MGIEPKAIEISTYHSRKVRESIAELTRLVLEEISLLPSSQQGGERG